MSSVARNAFNITAALISQKILSFVYFTLLARFLGPEMVGKYTFALAFTTIFAVITDFGLTPVLIREVARDKERAEAYVRTALWLKIGFIAIAYATVLGMAGLFNYPRLTIQLIAIAGIVMTLDATALTLYGVLRGMQNLRYEALGIIVGQAITLLLGVIALATHAQLWMFIGVLAIGSIWNVAYAWRCVWRQKISAWPRLHREIARIILKTSIPFALSGIFVRVYSYIDTVLLQHMKGDLAVGWYSVPYKITYAFQMLPLALSAAVYPALSAAWSKDKEKVQWIFEQAIRYSVIIVFPVVLGIAVLAREIILEIYGAQFQNSILPLQISIFGLLFIFLYFPVGALLNATDNQRVNTWFMGWTMGINIVLNILLIPRHGAVGASIAAVFTNAFLWLGTLLWSFRLVRPSGRVFLNFVKTTTSALLMAGVVWSIKQFVFWPISIIIGAIIYTALLWSLRVVRVGDFKKVLELIRAPAISRENLI